ncbi:MAG: hypothetical protein AAF915_15395 [Cyanobacteria bacterium P01_D01_bin.50]
MTESFNQSLYDASVRALTDNGVPEDLAEKASQVIASDDPTQENLGRSASDQEAVNEAMNHYCAQC